MQQQNTVDRAYLRLYQLRLLQKTAQRLQTVVQTGQMLLLLTDQTPKLADWWLRQTVQMLAQLNLPQQQAAQKIMEMPQRLVWIDQMEVLADQTTKVLTDQKPVLFEQLMI